MLRICLTPEGQSQDHFRATSGAHELRVCVGLKGTFLFVLFWVFFCLCSLGPTTFLGSEHDFHMLDRILVG